MSIKKTILCAAILTLLSLNLYSNAFADTAINDDIRVSDYQPVTLMQGMGNVFPVFKIKNTGTKIYNNIRLIYSTPKGLSNSGKKVELERTGTNWARISLKPGQEVVFNPSHKAYTYLTARTDQELTTYSATYYFYFDDEQGVSYQTSRHQIELFARVIPYNKDIIISHYQPVTLMQGMGNVFPLFKIKNTGTKNYKNIRLIYSTPKGLSNSGKKVELERTGTNWARISLKPGQEIVFNPSHKAYTYLTARTDQELTTYSTTYYFYFDDENDHFYHTPPKTIETFANLIAFNNDIIITQYSPVALKPGTSNIFPVFKIQNTGSRAYKNIRLIYSTPKGLSNSGKKVELERTGTNWARISLKPGQEIVFNPSHKAYTYLTARTDQELTTYSATYYFYFDDQNDHFYRTPSRTIENFAIVHNTNNSPHAPEYSQPPIKNTKSESSASGAGKGQADLEWLKSELDKEIDKLKKIVAPQLLDGIINIRKRLDAPPPESSKHSVNKTSSKSSIFEKLFNTTLANAGINPASEDARLAKNLARNVFNPLKTEKEFQKDLDAIVKNIISN